MKIEVFINEIKILTEKEHFDDKIEKGVIKKHDFSNKRKIFKEGYLFEGMSKSLSVYYWVLFGFCLILAFLMLKLNNIGSITIFVVILFYLIFKDKIVYFIKYNII